MYIREVFLSFFVSVGGASVFKNWLAFHIICNRYILLSVHFRAQATAELGCPGDDLR